MAFAQAPADARTSCIAVLAATRDPWDSVNQSRSLGTPVVFVCFEDRLQWWKQGPETAELEDTIEASQVANFFEVHRNEFGPDAVYRAKTWGRFNRDYQLSFVDLGLMPLVEEQVGIALSELIERCVSTLKNRLDWKKTTNAQGHWLLQSVFWLISAKILRDKSVDNFEDLSLTAVKEVFTKLGKHYGSEPVAIADSEELSALRATADEINRFSNLELTTTESLAYVYENTLVSKETRALLGTHSTPAYLVDYVVGNLADWIAEIPENKRSVFEPACGHAAFLVSAMRLLTELLPEDKRIPHRRRPYLRSRIRGLDIDPFALELARLSLTLTDIPNPDGWGLEVGDMFARGVLAESSRQSTIVLANPPFENFTAEKRAEYATRGASVDYINKAAEMLARVFSALPEGGVFGFVLPQAFLHSNNARELRRQIATEFEIREISLLADKVFSVSDAESALLLGRKKLARRSSVRFRRVRERDVDSFRKSYNVSSSRMIPQIRFLESEATSFRIPELEELWNFLAKERSLGDVATIGQGLIYHGSDLPEGVATFSDKPFEGAEEGFVWFDSGLQIHQLPKSYWLNLDPHAIRRPVAGTTVDIPQVLLNYASASRGPWRLKGILDKEGHPVTSRFIAIRPNDTTISLETIWAIGNSPVANAYAYSHLGKRDNIVGDIRRIPIPKRVPSDIDKWVQDYFNFAERDDANREMRNCLLKIDAALIDAYSLPVDLEYHLLKLFSGYSRVGVPFSQTEYLPDGIQAPIRLKDFLQYEKQGWEKTNRQRGRLIDKKITGSLSEEEKLKLSGMQGYADYYLERTTPRAESHFEILEKCLSSRKDT